ncbi:MAG: hypothetical protein Q9160_002121 [Pyrenula sp. 1 TL-2023]
MDSMYSDQLFSEWSSQYQPTVTPNQRAKDIAIIGGGVTGLTAAFHLSKQLPSAKVTVFEKSKTLGGWLRSELIEVDGGHVVFENGPRTLRNDFWGARYTKDLISQLDLAADLVRVSKNSAAARNRFIYYPDHLVRLPGRLPDASLSMNILANAALIWREPLFDKLISGLWHNVWDWEEYERSEDVRDESVGAFLARNFNQNITNNLVSAGFHGIYAGDIDRLSARSLLPLFWKLERRCEGLNHQRGILSGLIQLQTNGQSMIDYNDATLRAFTANDVSHKPREELESTLSGTSVFTFRKGLGHLAESLVSRLELSNNVTLNTSSQIDTVRYESGKKRLTIAEGGKQSSFDYVVSTLPPSTLANLIRLGKRPNHGGSKIQESLLSHTYAVNVMVVNLYYAQPKLTPVPGFGYLIPKTVPLEQNPERGLGVLFGSDSSIGQDTAPGTKMTVMLGGHWWDDWSTSDLPDEASGIEMAQAIVQRHLGISDKPVVAKGTLQRHAIPQYTVGHRERLHRIHENLLDQFDGRIKVGGNWYHGVGVNDCIKAARRCVHSIREGLDRHTGLETFGGSEKWALWNRGNDAIAI